MSKFTEKLIKWQTDKTPETDKLAHYYWGNRFWAFIGTLIALSILLIIVLFFTIYWWCLLISFTPIITSYLAASAKEKRDATGLGNSEKADIKYTVAPAFIQCFLLIIIIIALMF